MYHPATIRINLQCVHHSARIALSGSRLFGETWPWWPSCSHSIGGDWGRRGWSWGLPRDRWYSTWDFFVRDLPLRWPNSSIHLQAREEWLQVLFCDLGCNGSSGARVLHLRNLSWPGSWWNGADDSIPPTPLGDWLRSSPRGPITSPEPGLIFRPTSSIPLSDMITPQRISESLKLLA